MGDKIIPDDIVFICLKFYFMKKDCFAINNAKSFNYIPDEHGYCYHIFGTELIERGVYNKYKWIIETSNSFGGRFGIIDNKYIDKIKDGSYIWMTHSNNCSAYIGSYNWSGAIFGNDDYRVGKGDKVTIQLDYTNNTLTFTLQSTNETASATIREQIQAVKFFAEMGDSKSTISFV